jgi:hypothetical protein
MLTFDINKGLLLKTINPNLGVGIGSSVLVEAFSPNNS